jgi:hypothetical protein
MQVKENTQCWTYEVTVRKAFEHFALLNYDKNSLKRSFNLHCEHLPLNSDGSRQFTMKTAGKCLQTQTTNKKTPYAITRHM